MYRLKQMIGDLIGKIGLSIFKKRLPIIKTLLEHPEDLMAEIYIVQDGSITIHLRERPNEYKYAGNNE